MKTNTITGADFKALRLKKKMTQKEFADKLEYANYQRILEIEKAAKKQIPKLAELKLKILKWI